MILPQSQTNPTSNLSVASASRHSKNTLNILTKYRKPATGLLGILTVCFISGCQQMPYQHSQPQTLKKQRYIMGQSTCLKQSRYTQPQVSGKIIDTPRYMLITIRDASHNASAQKNQGELCIVNKTDHSIDITAIDRLRFLEGIQ